MSLVRTAGVVIVGGGVVGTAIAYFLGKMGAGRDVVLLEKNGLASGRLMAELVLTGPTTGIDVAPLDITRFARGALVREPLVAYAEVIEG